MIINHRMARTSAPVLITGETGTGKEAAAQAVHDLSGRTGAFVAVNCAALPESLAESELFGHVRGAFTGASDSRQGAFVAASKGTLFLDEIGEATLATQARLLRVLSSGDATPVGGTKSHAVTCRVVCATNVDLRAAVSAGRFRADLLYRIDVHRVTLRPLRQWSREEREDKARVLLAAANAEHGTSCAIGDTTALHAYDWPGNVRELKNAIERECIANETDYVLQGLPTCERPSLDAVLTLRDVREIERRAIANAVERAGGNVAQAARLLGINRTTLVEKMKRQEVSA